jgi:anthranilate phosphoribosyltransferase
MPVCYVLIRSQPGKENVVFKNLKKIPGIHDSHILFGDYDIITKLESESFDQIGLDIIERIRKIEGVVDTKTFPCTSF